MNFFATILVATLKIINKIVNSVANAHLQERAFATALKVRDKL